MSFQPQHLRQRHVQQRRASTYGSPQRPQPNPMPPSFTSPAPKTNAFRSVMTPFAANLFRRTDPIPETPMVNKRMNTSHFTQPMHYMGNTNAESTSDGRKMRFMIAFVLVFLGFILWAFSQSIPGALVSYLVYFLSLGSFFMGIIRVGRLAYEYTLDWWYGAPIASTMFSSVPSQMPGLASMNNMIPQQTMPTNNIHNNTQNLINANSISNAENAQPKTRRVVFSGMGNSKAVITTSADPIADEAAQNMNLARVDHLPNYARAGYKDDVSSMVEDRFGLPKRSDDGNSSPQRLRALNRDQIYDDHSLTRYLKKEATSMNNNMPVTNLVGGNLGSTSGTDQSLMSPMSSGAGFHPGTHYGVADSVMDSFGRSSVSQHAPLESPVASNLPKGAPGATPLGKFFSGMSHTPAPNRGPTSFGGGNNGSFVDNNDMIPSRRESLDVGGVSSGRGASFYKHSEWQSPMDMDSPTQQTSQQSSQNSFAPTGLGRHQPNLGRIQEERSPNHNQDSSYDYRGFYDGVNFKEGNGERKYQPKPVPRAVQPPQPQMSPFSRRRDIQRREMRKARSANPMLSFDADGKSKWRGQYTELAITLYKELRIEQSIHNWAEAAKWYLMEDVITERYKAWLANDKAVERTVQYLKNEYPNFRAQFDALDHLKAKATFILDNEAHMRSVAQQRNNPKLWECVQKRKLLHQSMAKIHLNQDYIFQRLHQWQQTQPLADYKWNKGGVFENQLWNSSLPCDAHLLMSLFIQSMDDMLCPAVEFSKTHYIEISLTAMTKLHKLKSHFKDIAIVAVTSIQDKHESVGVNEYNTKLADLENISLPYYFIIFDKSLFTDTAHSQQQTPVKNKPHRYYYHSSYDSENDSNARNAGADGAKSDKKKKSVMDVDAWYPQPCERNVFQCLALFTLFVHRYLKDTISGVQIAGNGSKLVQKILSQ